MKQSENLISYFDTSYEFQRKVENMLIEETRKKMKCDNFIEAGKKLDANDAEPKTRMCSKEYFEHFRTINDYDHTSKKIVIIKFYNNVIR